MTYSNFILKLKWRSSLDWMHHPVITLINGKQRRYSIFLRYQVLTKPWRMTDNFTNHVTTLRAWCDPVSSYVHEDTPHPWLPRVKLVQKVQQAQVWASGTQDRSYPWGWKIGPLVGPSSRPSWIPLSMGNPHRAQPLYIHTYITLSYLGQAFPIQDPRANWA